MLDDPGSFKTKEESKLGVLEHILQPELYPELYGNIFHKVRINYYPPRGDNKEGWDNIDIFGWLGYPMQIKVDFLCRDSILAAPIVLDLVLLMDLAKRCSELRGLGIQEWLSFYFKSPMTVPGLISRTRFVYSVDEAEEHAAAFEGRGIDHAFGVGVLRLARVARAPSPARNYLKPSQASGGSIADSMSPTILMMPLSRPKNFFFGFARCASFA